MERNPIDQERFPYLWLLYQRELAFRQRMEQLAEIFALKLFGVPIGLALWFDPTAFDALSTSDYVMAPVYVLMCIPFLLAWIKADIRKKMLARLRAIEEAAQSAENPTVVT